MKKITLFLSMATLLICFGNLYATCAQVNKESDELQKWGVRALQSNKPIGCPSMAKGSALYNLDVIAKENNSCSDQAIVALISFYSFFAEQPNYQMCNLEKRSLILLASTIKDGQVCAGVKIDDLRECFSKVNINIAYLKTLGELHTTFMLAQKTANSNDVTGLSQMTLGFMYEYGEGTDQNEYEAIKWAKIALEKLDDSTLKINTLMLLSVANEDLGNIQSALNYAQQCASMGSKPCQEGVVRLNQKLKRAPIDFSKMSDAELQKIANSGQVTNNAE